MGVKKAKAKTSKKSSKIGGVVSSLGAKMLGSKASKPRGGRKRRVTPERLARQILILKLKRKLFRLKYGGR